jgi:endoglucanase
MRILHELCSIPTAPFVEQRVYDYIDSFARARPQLRLSKDSAGNCLLMLPGKRSPRTVFVAHTDHPGFVVRRMTGPTTVDADFRGGVPSAFVRGATVRFFPVKDSEVTGIVTGTTPSKERATFPSRVTVRLRRRDAVLPRGTPGMFDQGTARIRRAKFYCRVCDDLAGAAAALTMLDKLSRQRSHLRSTVAVLLTRAEETGFIGALAAVLAPKLLRRDDRIISIECSAQQPHARQGDGVIVRVGDRTSVFDSSLTHFLTKQAEALQKRDRTFRFQRLLMPGGSCEGTVFDAYGYTTAAACVALGNYHNVDRQKKRIGPEYVDVNDWKNMVKLFVAVAKHAHEFEPAMRPVKRKLEQRFAKLKSLL